MKPLTRNDRKICPFYIILSFFDTVNAYIFIFVMEKSSTYEPKDHMIISHFDFLHERVLILSSKCINWYPSLGSKWYSTLSYNTFGSKMAQNPIFGSFETSLHQYFEPFEQSGPCGQLWSRHMRMLKAQASWI